MHRLIFTFVALSIGSALFGCIGKRCFAMACAYTAEIGVVDENGDPVQRFSGTAMVDGTTYTFDCGVDVQGNGVQGGDELGFSTCYEGHLTLPFTKGERPSIDLVIQSSDGTRFEDTVTPEYVVNNNFNGKGCGTCTTGEVSVTLD